jgi:hypothetical protein
MGLYLVPLHAIRKKQRHPSTVHPHISTPLLAKCGVVPATRCPIPILKYGKAKQPWCVVILREAKDLQLVGGDHDI